MKKIVIITAILISLFACNDTKKHQEVDDKEQNTALKIAPLEIAEIAPDSSEAELQNSTSVNAVTSTKEESEEDITAKDSINFEKYAVEVQDVIRKAPLDFSSYPESKSFRTRITEAYSDGTAIDFAGHYIISAFGCGAGCIMGFMVDVRDGKIYDLPLGEQNSCFWSLDRALGKPDSRLFISAICKEEENNPISLYIAYVWNEEKKLFENVNKEEFIIKK
ncbi:MAG: hypothetical protein ACOH1O_06490 [Flavobacterium sp.]